MQTFLTRMETNLRVNEHKGDWKEYAEKGLLVDMIAQLDKNRERLQKALDSGNTDLIQHECVNIANRAMFIHHHFGFEFTYDRHTLEELGFSFEDVNLGFVDKVIDPLTRLILQFDEGTIVVYTVPEDYTDFEIDGTRIVLDTEDVCEAIRIAEKIAGIDDGF